MITAMYGCNVCDACEIAYPRGTHECPVCENVTRYVGGRSPHHDWQTRVHDLLHPQPEPVGGPAVAVHPVKDERGRLWLYVAELRAVGYRAELETFDRFVTDEGLVELQGYDAPRKRWWIEVL